MKNIKLLLLSTVLFLFNACQKEMDPDLSVSEKKQRVNEILKRYDLEGRVTFPERARIEQWTEEDIENYEKWIDENIDMLFTNQKRDSVLELVAQRRKLAAAYIEEQESATTDFERDSLDKAYILKGYRITFSDKQDSIRVMNTDYTKGKK